MVGSDHSVVQAEEASAAVSIIVATKEAVSGERAMEPPAVAMEGVGRGVVLALTAATAVPTTVVDESLDAAVVKVAAVVAIA